MTAMAQRFRQELVIAIEFAQLAVLTIHSQTTLKTFWGSTITF